MLLLLLTLVSADTSRTLMIPVAPAESLAVTIVGEGAPVVLIPGLFGSSYGYRHVMALLDSAGYQSVGIEPLGMGTSSRPENADYSLTAQADRIAAALDTLGIQQSVLVGHSLGASIALRVAYRHPGSARGVVSLEGGPGETATTDGFRSWMRFAPAARLLDVRQVMQRLLYSDMKKMSHDDSWVESSVVLAYTAGLARDSRATIKAYQAMGKSEEPELLRDHLQSILCPVVLLVGDKEHKAGPPGDEIALLGDLLQSFTIDTIAESGFFIQEEQPAAVVSVVSGFEIEQDCGTAPS